MPRGELRQSYISPWSWTTKGMLSGWFRARSVVINVKMFCLMPVRVDCVPQSVAKHIERQYNQDDRYQWQQ